MHPTGPAPTPESTPGGVIPGPPDPPPWPIAQPGPASASWDAFAPTSRPRIEPSSRPSESKRFIRGLLSGLTAGLIVFGAAGFLLGHVTNTPPKTPAPALPLFERTQQALNRPKFPPALAPMAQGWLPYLSACAGSGDPGGPALGPGEKAKVRCTVSGMSAVFIEYNSPAEWNKARTTAQKQYSDAATLTPGAGPPTASKIEYAYRVTEGKAVRTVSAIRWEESPVPVAGYLLAYWTDGVGSNWAPMRDLWGRYA